MMEEGGSSEWVPVEHGDVDERSKVKDDDKPVLAVTATTALTGGEHHDHAQRLMSLLDGKTDIEPDVTFVVGPEKAEVKGHQLLLRVHSPVLNALFSKAAPGHRVVPVEDADLDEFKLFLKFLYTGPLSEEEMEASAGSLLKYAIQFRVGDLETECCAVLKTSMSVSSAVALYEQGAKCTKDSLRSQAQAFILRNASHILDSDEFLNLSQESLSTILASDNLEAISETQVFKAVLKWAEEQCRRANEDPKNGLRNAMAALIPLIRFPAMNKSDFSLIVPPSNVLTCAELVSVLLYFNVDQDKRCDIAVGPFNHRPRTWFDPTLTQTHGATEYFVKRLFLAKEPLEHKELATGRLLKASHYIDCYGTFMHQIKFRVDTPIWMSSIGLNQGHDHYLDTVMACIKVIHCDSGDVLTVEEADVDVIAVKKSAFNVKFRKAVRLRPRVWYAIKLFLPTGCYEPYWYATPEGDDGRRRVVQVSEGKAITVDFDEVLPLEYPCVTGLTQGFIPTIGFKLDAK